ncbi:hypothetical protein DPMN_044792 [Dreissena polymorpha]|uniref:Uncharacterized protein n=1 Tax=Dreissena polymorpha TaxID=45954 RepID=A0A9D4D4S7_DREPO|nr:hypothetical protein DPMN_044792 [Dreissena polymorpha]
MRTFAGGSVSQASTVILRTGRPFLLADSLNVEGSPSGKVNMRRWIVVSLHRRNREGSSGCGSEEDERDGLWAQIQARISREWHYE